MRLIKMTGGLGNQMFIYALYLRMRRRYPHTRIDLSDMMHYHAHNGYELPRVFDTPPSELTLPRWLKKAMEFLFFRTILERHERGSLRHYDGPVRWPLVYYKGFYQRTAYLEGIEDEVRQTFRFQEALASPRSLELLRRIEADEASVSLHVRRGDYLQEPFYSTIGCVCTEAYYRQALAALRERVPGMRCYVFSDDPAWVCDHLDLPEAVYVDWNQREDSWQDMMLMSRCRHHIISNSTFSWWGAWLGSGKGCITAAPDRWFARQPLPPDLYPGGWLRVPTEEPPAPTETDDQP